MKSTSIYIIAAFFALILSSCAGNGEKSDAYGNFEADEVIVSSQANGMISYLDVDEGAELNSGAVVGVVDTVQLSLKKQQLITQKDIIRAKTRNIAAQAEVVKAQKTAAEREKARFEKLLKDDAATQKQLDDIISQISVFESQIKSINTQGITVNDEIRSLDLQIEQLDDQIKKCYVVNPIEGTVLTKYANEGEITAFGKPLYKIAGMSEIYLKVYVSGDQLSKAVIGNKAQVLVDAGSGTVKTVEGTVSWISDKAEFTPKIIQTKEERVSLVYAVKIRVKNDGSLKIGMPGEANFKE